MNVAEAIVAMLIAATTAWMLFISIKTGVVNGEGGHQVARSDGAVRYWLQIVVGVVIMVVCILLALRKLGYL